MLSRSALRVILAGLIWTSSYALFLAPPAHAESTDFRVITHNIRGGQINNGALATLNTAQSQMAWNPDVVMLQEVCRSQEQAFRINNPTWHVHYVVWRTHPTCNNGAPGDIGELIATPHRVGAWEYDEILPGDGTNAVYRASCLVIAKNGREYFTCNTHLSPNSDSIRDAQVSQIQLMVLYSLSISRGVVIAGDLNMEPSNNILNRLYKIRNDGTLTGGGNFFEADQGQVSYFRPACLNPTQPFCRSGEPTMGSRKFDYIFFSSNAAPHNGANLSGGVVSAALSNHDLSSFSW